MKRTKPVALHSHTSELVRCIRAAHRQLAEAREDTRRLARLLYAYRAAKIKPNKNGALYMRYRVSHARLSNAAHLLKRMQAKYKTKFGRPWVLRRRDLHTGAAIGRRIPERSSSSNE